MIYIIVLSLLCIALDDGSLLRRFILLSLSMNCCAGLLC